MGVFDSLATLAYGVVVLLLNKVYIIGMQHLCNCRQCGRCPLIYRQWEIMIFNCIYRLYNLDYLFGREYSISWVIQENPSQVILILDYDRWGLLRWCWLLIWRVPEGIEKHSWWRAAWIRYLIRNDSLCCDRRWVINYNDLTAADFFLIRSIIFNILRSRNYSCYRTWVLGRRLCLSDLHKLQATLSFVLLLIDNLVTCGSSINDNKWYFSLWGECLCGRRSSSWI